MAVPDIAQRVVAERLTYLSAAKLESLFACVRSVKQSGVVGDFLEFGVALGGSAICLASELDPSRRFVGFDLFGMIPPVGQGRSAFPGALLDDRVRQVERDRRGPILRL